MKIPSGISPVGPPADTSLKEQGKWWLRHPELIPVAHAMRWIPENVYEEMLAAAQDFDLAMKVVDRKKVPGLTEEERTKIVEKLIGLDICVGSGKKGRKPKTARNLRIALAIDGATDPRERNRIAREMAGGQYGTDNNNVSKLLKEVEETKLKYSNEDLIIALAILQESPDLEPTEEELGCLIKLWKYLLVNEQETGQSEE